MKYHNNMKTILITAFVVLLFLSVSVFLLVKLNLTSPTMIITNRLMESVSSVDASITLEFESLERNFRDRVMLNNFSLYHNGEELAFFSKIEVKLGLFDAISYIFNLGGSAEVAFSDGRITIPSSLLGGKDDEGKGGEGEPELEDFSLSSFLSSHSITLSFENTSLVSSFGEGVIDSLYLSYLGDEETLVGELKTDSFSLSYNGCILTLTRPEISFSYGDTLFADISLSGAGLTGNGISLSSYGASVKASSSSIENIRDGIFTSRISLSSLSLSSDDISLGLSGLSFIYTEDKTLSGSINSFAADGAGYSAALSKIEAEIDDFNSFSVNAQSIEGNLLSVPFKGTSLSAGGNMEEKTFSFLFDEVGAGTGSVTGNAIEKVTIMNGDISLLYGDSLSLSVKLDADAVTSPEGMDDISFSLDGNIDLKDGKITTSALRVNDLYLGYGEEYDSLLLVTGNTDKAEISLDYGFLKMLLTASVTDKTLSGTLSLDSLSLSKAMNTFHLSEIGIFNENSILTLSSSFSLTADDEDGRVTGSLDYDFKVDSLDLSFVESYLSSSGTLLFTHDTIVIEDINLSTSYFDMTAGGSFDLRQYLPTLDFRAATKNGKEILNGYIHLGETRYYNFLVTSSSLKDTTLTGSVDFNTSGIVSSSSILSTKGKERPFSLSVDLDDRSFSLSSDNLLLSFDYSDGLKGRAEAHSLETLTSDDGETLVVNGSVDISYSLEEGLSLSSDTIRISDIFVLPSSPSVSFRVNGESEKIRLDDIRITFPESNDYSGALSVDFSLNSVVLALDEEDGIASLLFSLYKDDEFIAVLKADDVDLSFLGLDGMYAYLNLYGRAKKIEDFSFTGTLDITSPDNDRRAVNGELTIDGESLVISDVVYSSEDVTASLDRLYINAKEGNFALESLSFRLENEKPDRSYPVSGVVSLSGTMDETDSLYSSAVNLIKSGGDGVDFRLTVENIDLDSSLFVIENKYLDASIGKDEITLGGNFLSGTISKEKKNGFVNVSIENIVVASLEFDLSSSLDATCLVEEFNMGLVNLLLKYPTLIFRDDLVSGEASLTERGGEYSLNGALHAKELGVEVFWVEDQELIFHNPQFIIWDNELTSSLTYVTVYDNLTDERKTVEMTVGVAMSETLSMESWEVDVYIEDGNTVRIRIPLPHIGIDIIGNVSGHYYAYSDSVGMDNDGILNLSDTVVSIGMNPYPKWYDELGGPTFLDLELNFGKNNRVLYPAGDDPIFSIDLQENSSVYGYMGSDGTYSFTGDIQVRGGEIYYFQKYFYITSGSISFDDPDNFNPKINLRATLRDYTSSNEKVEIYLVMKDNTFDNLSPTLESSPVMELSEIMEILGQSILPQSTYGSVSVSSMASLVTEGFDILSRLGIVTSGNPLSSLSSSLKSVFGVDSFSLHSNILNNIVADTISQATNAERETYSPMARFLNGTTLNIGKYITQNLYMQAMINLEATESRKSYTIISDDLALDTEFSLEWTAGAFNVTFYTRPSYFSFDSILSSFGFTITKTINF